MEEIAHSYADAGLEGGDMAFRGMAKTWAAVQRTPFGGETVEEAAEKKRGLVEAVEVLARTIEEHEDGLADNVTS